MKQNFSKKNVSLIEKSHLSWWRILLLVVGGSMVGLLSGLFGGGGGTLVIPLLILAGKLGERKAHATSIAVILPIAIVSAIVYLVQGTVADFHVGTLVVIGVFLGGLIGTLLLQRLNVGLLKIAFYIIMMVAGVRMII